MMAGRFAPYPTRPNRCAALTVAIALALVAPTAAETSDGNVAPSPYLSLPQPDEPYPFVASDIDVQEALRAFARNLRIGLVVDEAITGVVPGDFGRDMTRGLYIDALALEFDFIWYFDGRILRVSPVGEIQTEILSLQNNTGADVLRILRELDIYQSSFTHRSDERNRTFLVTGPADYVALVKKAVEAIEAADRTRVSVLRGSEGSVPPAIGALQDAEATDAPVETPMATTGGNDGGQAP